MLCGILLVSCREKVEPVRPVRPVKMMTLTEPGLFREVSYPARVEAIQQADLSFRVPGRIIEIPVRRGEEVQAGQVLAKLDPEDYQNEFNAAKTEAEARKAFLERTRQAFDKGVASLSELDKATSDYENARTRLELARKALEDTVLKAPFDGQIGRQMKEAFQDVQANEPVFRLQDVTRLKIVVDVPESVLMQARRAQRTPSGESRTRVAFNDLPGESFPAVYYEDERTADPLTGTYAVAFVMEAPESVTLLPGMTATLSGRLPIPTTKGASAFYLPASAVVSSSEGSNQVWVIDPSTSTAHGRDVTLGAMVGDRVEVLEGLELGETVAVSGVHSLREGMKVRPYQEEGERAP